MDDDLPMYSFSVALVRWLLSTVIVLGSVNLILLAFHEDRGPARPKTVITKGISNPSFTTEHTGTWTVYETSFADEIEGEGPYQSIINQTAHRHQVDPALVKAIIMAESGYNPKAISEKGAMGLMQLMPETAEALGVEDSFNPEHNIEGGVRYFKQLIIQFDGDVTLALAAYNAGSKTVRNYQGIPPFKATQFYIEKVFKYYLLYKHQPVDETDRA